MHKIVALGFHKEAIFGCRLESTCTDFPASVCVCGQWSDWSDHLASIKSVKCLL